MLKSKELRRSVHGAKQAGGGGEHTRLMYAQELVVWRSGLWPGCTLDMKTVGSRTMC